MHLRGAVFLCLLEGLRFEVITQCSGWEVRYWGHSVAVGSYVGSWPSRSIFSGVTTADCYVCSLYARIRIRTPAFLLFLKPIFIIWMDSLVVNPANAASRCDHSCQGPLRRRPQSRHSTNAQSLFCNRGGLSLSYLSRSSACSRSSAQNQGGGSAHTRTGGLYTLHHHMRHRRTTPHNSTHLLDSSHCDELQARPPTVPNLPHP